MTRGVHEVRIARVALEALLGAHRAAREEEPCAVLLGATAPERIEVWETVPVRNAHPVPARAFLLEPAALLAAASRARERGLDVVGTWHGHPRGDASLSPADAAGLLLASSAPGAGGEPAARAHAFLVSGRGAGGRVVVRAYVGRGGDAPACVPLRVPPSAA